MSETKGFKEATLEIVAMLDEVAKRGINGGEQPYKGFPKLRIFQYRLDEAEQVRLRKFCHDFLPEVRRSGCGLIGCTGGHPGDLVRHVQALESYALRPAAPETKPEPISA